MTHIEYEEVQGTAANLLVRYGVSVIERGAGTPMREQIDPALNEFEALILERENKAKLSLIGALEQATEYGSKPENLLPWIKIVRQQLFEDQLRNIDKSKISGPHHLAELTPKEKK